MNYTARPKVVGYKLEPWEEEYLRARLEGVELIATAAQLGTQNAELASAGSVGSVGSVFIRSGASREVLARIPEICGIATRSTGYDHIDVAACRERGLVVSNVPTYGENTVAEHTFGLMLALSRKIHQAYVRTTQGNFSLQGLRGVDLRGRTLGVAGTGHIGLHVIRIGRGFGMRVVATELREQPLLAEVLGFDYLPLDDLLARSDIVSLHVPYTPETHHLQNKDRLTRMRRGSRLIDTARGGLVDAEALLWALDEGILAGAGLDVIEGEELMAEEQQLLCPGVATEKLQAVIRGHVQFHRENSGVHTAYCVRLRRSPAPHPGHHCREQQRTSPRQARESSGGVRSLQQAQYRQPVPHFPARNLNTSRRQ